MIAKASPHIPDSDTLQLAFHSSAQASIVCIVSTGKIVIANKAAGKLLGYSNRELLSKFRKNIFDIQDTGFKKMFKQRTTDGHCIAVVIAVKKSGKTIPCEISSAVFTGEDGVEKSITSFSDISKNIKEQKTLDKKNQKIVAENIAVALEKSEALVVEKTEWIKCIAKTSYDVMWDWDIVSGNVYVGDSIKEVFGYKIKNNSIDFLRLKKNLLAGDSHVAENLHRVLASTAKNWNDSYAIKRSDGSIASVTSRASIVRDENGKAIRLIGATLDITRLKELENRLDAQNVSRKENNDIFPLAAKVSYDGIWDWNILTDQYFLGEGFEQLFGTAFNKIDNKSFAWSDFLHPDDKVAVETGLSEALASSASSWEHAYRFIRTDGSTVDVLGRASILRDANGKACRMIGVIHDLTRQHDLEARLELEIAETGKLLSEQTETLRLMFNSSSDILYDIDLATDEILLSDGYDKAFGYAIVPNMKTADVWGSHLHPDDKEAVMCDYRRMLISEETAWKYAYRFLRSDGSVANILSSRIILRHGDGTAYRMLGSMQDVSQQKVLEEKLEKVIKLNEKQIADAMLDAKETERSDLGKELHDNVNQLLGASRLYLEMAKQGGPEGEQYLSRSSEYTLSAIEEIRKISKGLTTDTIQTFGLCDSIEKMMKDLMQISQITFTASFDREIEDMTSDKFKLNLFRILQEQVNNILKHSQATKVKIRLLQGKKTILFAIADNGVGFDATLRTAGIGIDNIKSRASAYGGKAQFISRPGEGCVLKIAFGLTGGIASVERHSNSLCSPLVPA